MNYKHIKNNEGSFIHAENKYKPNKKILALDLDWTIIKPKSGSKFPKNGNDWEFLFGDKTISKLREYLQKGYNLVIFTNQKNIDKPESTKFKYSLDDFKSRNNEIISLIYGKNKYETENIVMFIANNDDFFRKPAIGMWEYFVKEINRVITIEECIYVGDAAGRKGDHSFTDIAFTYNINKLFYGKNVIDFKTPEEFFLDDNSKTNSGKELLKKMEKNTFVPEIYLNKLNIVSNEKNNKESLVKIYDIMKKARDEDKNILMIFVGAMGSGKSSFYKKNIENVIKDAGDEYAKSWHYMNMDTYEGGTITKFKKDIKKYLIAGESVIIDNTNPKPETRKEYINMMKENNIDGYIIGVEFEMDRDLVEHLNDIRNKYLDVCEHDDSKECKMKKIPRVAIAVYFKNYKKIDNDEGFDNVVRMQFIPEFENDADKRKFMMVME